MAVGGVWGGRERGVCAAAGVGMRVVVSVVRVGSGVFGQEVGVGPVCVGGFGGSMACAESVGESVGARACGDELGGHKCCEETLAQALVGCIAPAVSGIGRFDRAAADVSRCEICDLMVCVETVVV